MSETAETSVLAGDELKELMTEGESTEPGADYEMQPIAADITLRVPFLVLRSGANEWAFSRLGVFVQGYVVNPDDPDTPGEQWDVHVPYDNVAFIRYWFETTDDEDGDSTSD